MTWRGPGKRRRTDSGIRYTSEVRTDVVLPEGQIALWAVTRMGDPPSEEERAWQADWDAATFAPLEETDPALAREVAEVLVDELLRTGGLSVRRRDEALAALRSRRGLTPRGTTLLVFDLPLGVACSTREWDGSRASALDSARSVGQWAGEEISADRPAYGPSGWEPEFDT